MVVGRNCPPVEFLALLPPVGSCSVAALGLRGFPFGPRRLELPALGFLVAGLWVSCRRGQCLAMVIEVHYLHFPAVHHLMEAAESLL